MPATRTITPTLLRREAQAHPPVTLAQALQEQTPVVPEAVYYVVLTVGYNSEYQSDLTSTLMTYEKAKMQYDRIVATLYCDKTGNFYGVALMQSGNPVAVEVEVL